MSISLLIAWLPFAAWIYLAIGRGMFWCGRERDTASEPAQYPAQWPSVTAVVPARNEAELIARSIRSLLAQDYPGRFRVVVVDDDSQDRTAEAAGELDRDGRLTVLAGTPRAAGWTGKLCAVSQGVAHATDRDVPDYLWLTDADIAHVPDNLRHLVMRAEHSKLALVSLMAKLRCDGGAERFFVPAFVYFFQMLYPFGWVNSPDAKTAAAAGGCMLVRRAALEAAGGIAAVRSAIIDDCALARSIKGQGPIWLGLTERAVSLRPYAGMEDIRRMVVRSAYAELNYSPLRLAATLIGLMMMFVGPPLLAVFGGGASRIAGIASWGVMAATFAPMLRFYGRSPLWGLALPLIGFAYAGFTLDSAIQHWRGRGGMWKGRAQAIAQP
jgi:hopene-associated glycosyltransferase HpnB